MRKSTRKVVGIVIGEQLAGVADEAFLAGRDVEHPQPVDRI